MKKTWKLVTIVLMIGLVVGMIISNSTNAAGVSLSTEHGEVTKDDNIQVTISGSGAKLSYINGLILNYDTNYLEYKSCYSDEEKDKALIVTDHPDEKKLNIQFNQNGDESKMTSKIVLNFIAKQATTKSTVISPGRREENETIIRVKADQNAKEEEVNCNDIPEISINIKEKQEETLQPELSTDTVSLKVGDIADVTITNNANMDGYTWSSDNANIATVEGTTNGCKITGKSEGTTTVKLSNETVTKKVNVTVEPKETQQQLTINPTSATIAKNGTQKFELNKQGNCTWSSDNENVAKVDSTGLVTGVGVGTATITATITTTDGTETVSATITVTDNSQPDPTPDPTPNPTPTPDPTPDVPTGEQIDVGKSTTITIGNKSSISGNCTWKSDNESVAIVDNNGTITGVAKGTANITVTTPTGKSATIKVTVNEVDNSDTSKPVLTPASITVPEGYTFTITSDKPVTWMIGSEGVAKIVSSDTTKATIQAVAKGQAMVIATSTANQDAQATTSIEVIEKQVEVVDNSNNGGNANNGGTANNGGSQGNSKTGGATTQNTSSSANEAVPATGENSVETIAILVIATLFIAAIVFRKRSRIK